MNTKSVNAPEEPADKGLDGAACSALEDARQDGRRSIIAKLAYWHGGHNASENSWGRLGMQVATDDDEAVAEYFYKEISADARKPLEAEIAQLKARLFDLQNVKVHTSLTEGELHSEQGSEQPQPPERTEGQGLYGTTCSPS